MTRNNLYKRPSKFYRCRCVETGEEKIFATPNEAKTWSRKVVHTSGARSTFTLTQVRESQTQYAIDTFGRLDYIP